MTTAERTRPARSPGVPTAGTLVGWRGLVFTVCLLGIAAKAAAEVPDRAFVQHVEQRIVSGDYVGLIVGVIDGGETTVASYGRTSKDGPAERPNDRTLFEISSVVKTFAATLLARAVTEGRVTLGDAANTYLEPEARLASFEGREITLLDLVAHQSGLPYMPESIEPVGELNPYAATTRAELLTAINAFTPTSSPGQGYSYSAFAYGILALVLERVYDADFASLVERQITTPLGMADTVLSPGPDQSRRLAAGYTPAGEPAVPFEQGAFRPAGSMYSTLHDLMIWVRANMAPESSPFGDALRLTQQMHNKLGTIGLAWHKSEQHDDRSQYGTANGYRAYAGFLADGSKGVVILANTIVDAEALGSHLLTGTALPE